MQHLPVGEEGGHDNHEEEADEEELVERAGRKNWADHIARRLERKYCAINNVFFGDPTSLSRSVNLIADSGS